MISLRQTSRSPRNTHQLPDDPVVLHSLTSQFFDQSGYAVSFFQHPKEQFCFRFAIRCVLVEPTINIRYHDLIAFPEFLGTGIIDII